MQEAASWENGALTGPLYHDEEGLRLAERGIQEYHENGILKPGWWLK